MIAKHLKEMEPANLERLQQGINRFRFGFAEPGERLDNAVYVKNFNKRKDARAERDRLQAEGKKVILNPYLYGKLATGWSVWTVEA